MKTKALLSSLVALSLVVSSYGVAFAESINGEVSTNDGVFRWDYNPSSGALSAKARSYSTPSNERDWGYLASDIKAVYLAGDDNSSAAYAYSDFRSGMDNVMSITVRGNCKKLAVRNYCPSLTGIDIADDRESYIWLDFSGRSTGKLPSIRLNNVRAKNIDVDFSNNTASGAVTIPSSYGVDSTITYDFRRSNMAAVTFNAGTKTIPQYAFYDCKNLSTVTIPDGVTSIEYGAFRSCPKLRKISIPASVKSIGMNAFKGSGLQEINFGGTCEAWFGLVKEYEDENVLVGDTLHIKDVTVRCKDGAIRTHYNAKEDRYYQTYEYWHSENGKIYYYLPNGELAKAATCIDTRWYYFSPEGVLQKGWINFSGNNYYYSDRMSGEMKESGWVNDSGNWYYIEKFLMVTGWKQVDGKWYYFDPGNGKMQTGWVNDGGKWYYMNSSGAMQTGWVSDGGKWYYMNSSGAMQTGWVNDGGKWYYMNASGVMQTGWIQDGGKWYYMESNGVMHTGWLLDGGKWYYLDPGSGAMVTGSRTIGGKTYNFNSSGVCLNP